MRACELDAAWTELAALDDPATPYHDGDTNLQKLDLHNLVEFSLSTQLHAGANVPTPYGGTYRVLSNGASPYLRLEFDVTGFEPAAYLVAQQIVPGLRSEIDPRPQANVHDENTAYVAAVHLRPGYARTIHEYVVDPVEVGNPGMGFGSPIKFAHPQYRGDGGVVGFGGETHRAGDRCDIFRSRAGGATVTDAEGMFLSCRDDPKGDCGQWADLGKAVRVCAAANDPNTHPTAMFELRAAATVALDYGLSRKFARSHGRVRPVCLQYWRPLQGIFATGRVLDEVYMRYRYWNAPNTNPAAMRAGGRGPARRVFADNDEPHRKHLRAIRRRYRGPYARFCPPNHLIQRHRAGGGVGLSCDGIPPVPQLN